MAMPLNRKMLAADSGKAEELNRIAAKRGSTLFSFTNTLIDAAILLDKAGYDDPREAALELVVMDTLRSLGFRLCLEKTSGGKIDWRTLGESIGMLLYTKLGKGSDPLRLTYSLLSFILGKNNVFFQDMRGNIALIATVPVDISMEPDDARSLVEGIFKNFPDGKVTKTTQKGRVIVIEVQRKATG